MDDNPSNWTCTLFKPERFDPTGQSFKLVHVYSGQHLERTDPYGIWKPNPKPVEVYTLFMAMDLESMIILPRHVAFKGSNGKYLRAYKYSNGRRYLVFDTDDKGHADSWFEVFTTGDQNIYVVQHSTQTSWTNEYDDSYIYSDKSNNGDVTAGKSFVPVKVDRSNIGIKGKLFFADTTYNSGVPEHCIQLRSPSLTASSHFGVEELVLERSIYNAVFDLANATIYGETPLVMATQTADNHTDEVNSMDLVFKYTDTKSSTWSSTNSWMVGVTVTASFSVPFISSGGVEAKTEFNGSYSWGETITKETSVETTYHVNVPPRSNIKVDLVATQGQCDVEYTFFQKDRLYDGTSAIFYKEDGLYTGINAFKFHYEVTTTPITEGLSSDESLTPKVEIISITPSVGQSEEVSATTRVNVPMPKPTANDAARAMLLPLEVIDQEI